MAVTDSKSRQRRFNTRIEYSAISAEQIACWYVCRDSYIDGFLVSIRAFENFPKSIKLLLTHKN